LYGLFKFLTVARTPSSSRPSIFDLTGRAKWDAWNDISKRFSDSGPEEAEKRYLTIAGSLGWREGVAVAYEPDSDSTIKGRSKGASGGGMGVAVSKLTQSEDDRDDRDSIHAVAISGDVSKLISLLKKNPKTDINERDDYVSSRLLGQGMGGFHLYGLKMFAGLYTTSSGLR
jgi:acyl-CoA-binding protein